MLSAKCSFLRMFALAAVLLCSIFVQESAFAHGFNADRVKILYVPADRVYRITIRYTHVEVGEYREAHIDFKKRLDALKVYWDLVNGADFFLGDAKDSVHFHEPVQKNKPY
jgi:hypothetical protein